MYDTILTILVFMQSGMHCMDGVQLTLDSPALASHCAHGTVGLLRKYLSNTNLIKLKQDTSQSHSCFNQFCNSNCIFRIYTRNISRIALLHSRKTYRTDFCLITFIKLDLFLTSAFRHASINKQFTKRQIQTVKQNENFNMLGFKVSNRDYKKFK